MAEPTGSGLLRPCACFTCTCFILLLVGFLIPDDTRPIEVMQMDATQLTAKAASPQHQHLGGQPPVDEVTPVTAKPQSLRAGPQVYRLEVLKRYRHDSGAFPQGLLYLGNDTLYESNGLYSKSNVRTIDLKTGQVLTKVLNNKSDFGEGLTYYKGYLWQVLWKSHKIFKYDPHTLQRLAEYATPEEFDYTDGWGLASISDGRSELYKSTETPQNEKLYITDSGTKLYVIDFVDEAFRLVSSVTVTMPDGEPLEMPNELELISENELWANIYGQSCIAQINPDTGKVFGWILADNLEREKGPQGGVFNGIAYDKKNKRIFVTGKQWSKLFEVKLVPVVASAAEIKRICVPKANLFHPGHHQSKR